MTLDNTILNLKKELIRAFAVLDGWFDKDAELLKYEPPADHSVVGQVLKQIMLTNDYMLGQINDGCGEAMKQAKLNDLNFVIKEYTLRKLEFEDPEVYHFFMNMFQRHQQGNDSPLYVIRTELRDQLDQCLCHLELMKNGEGAMHSSKLSANHARKIDMYQWIQLLAVHAEKQIEKLKKMEDGYNQQLAAR